MSKVDLELKKVIKTNKTIVKLRLIGGIHKYRLGSISFFMLKNRFYSVYFFYVISHIYLGYIDFRPSPNFNKKH